MDSCQGDKRLYGTGLKGSLSSVSSYSELGDTFQELKGTVSSEESSLYPEKLKNLLIKPTSQTWSLGKIQALRLDISGVNQIFHCEFLPLASCSYSQSLHISAINTMWFLKIWRHSPLSPPGEHRAHIKKHKPCAAYISRCALDGDCEVVLTVM